MGTNKSDRQPGAWFLVGIDRRYVAWTIGCIGETTSLLRKEMKSQSTQSALGRAQRHLLPYQPTGSPHTSPAHLFGGCCVLVSAGLEGPEPCRVTFTPGESKHIVDVTRA
ncbi:uncharacterized protein ACBT44_006869 isoform 1-T1 [Syngnathus typhle]